MKLATLGVALALLVAGCGSHTLDTPRLEAEIKHWAVKNSGGYQLIKVHCPDDVPIKAGNTFHCLVSDDQGNKIRVAVTIENDKGEVTWVQG